MSKSKYLLTALLLIGIITNVNSQSWTQIGENLSGTNSNDYFGQDGITVNSDGSVVAVGSSSNDNAGNNAGQVIVYENVEGTWVQMGTDIYGEEEDQLGRAISLSADGLRLAVGIPNTGNYYNGQVKIFEYNGTEWEQLGNAIDGVEENNFCGYNLDLNSSGNIVVISSPYNDDFVTDAGQIRIFEYNGTTWEQVGNSIYGENDGDNAGYVSINADGSILAIGAPYNDDFAPSAGHVRVFKNIDGTWTQQGDDIDGEAQNDFAGRVSISNDGLTVAIGAFGNDEFAENAGNVRIFNFDGTNWTQVGSDIYGEAEGDWAGSPCISGDASKVAIGAFRNTNAGGEWAGNIRVFEFNGTDWLQVGDDMDGVAENDGFGQALAFSNDGTTVIGGSPRSDDSGSNSGNARVFKYGIITSNPADQLDICSGELVEFSISGNEITDFQWKVSTDDGNNWTNISDNATYSGATTDILTVTTDFSLNNNQYHCYVSIGEVNQTSNSALLTIVPTPEITTQPAASTTICEGDESIILEVVVSGLDLTYQWNYEGSPIGGATSSTYTMSSNPANSGTYTCDISNSCETISSENAEILINPETEITTQPAASTTICEGDESIILEVVVSGIDLTYQWNYENSPIGGATNSTYIVSSNQVNSGTYTCDISSSCGTITSENAEILINPETEIITQPISQEEINTGIDITFFVEAEGANLIYQWQKDEVNLTNGGNINGSTTNELSITNISEADAGIYNCIVTGDCGELISDDALLSILTGINGFTENNFSIYPNPTTGIFVLDFPMSQKELENVSITDISGKIIYNSESKTVNSQISIDISDQPNGLYFIKLQTEQKMMIKKIIKK